MRFGTVALESLTFFACYFWTLISISFWILTRVKYKTQRSSATKCGLDKNIAMAMEIQKWLPGHKNSKNLTDAGVEPAISWFVVKRLAIGPAGRMRIRDQ